LEDTRKCVRKRVAVALAVAVMRRVPRVGVTLPFRTRVRSAVIARTIPAITGCATAAGRRTAGSALRVVVWEGSKLVPPAVPYSTYQRKRRFDGFTACWNDRVVDSRL
jgi:hypothetical protein